MAATRTTLFFLIPKNVTSERPIALMPTLIRWWEALRAPEVAKWQLKYRVEWDATDGRNGGPPANGVGNSDGDGKVQWHSKRRGSRSLGFVPGQSPTSASQGRSCECCAGTLSTRGECSSKDVRQSRYEPSRPFCQGPSELFASAHCSARCPE